MKKNEKISAKTTAFEELNKPKTAFFGNHGNVLSSRPLYVLARFKQTLVYVL